MVNFYEERTVRWKNGTVELIDQTRLPRNFGYVVCRDYKQVAKAIKTMMVRGAPAIGATAAMGLALAAYKSKAKTRNELIRDLRKAEKILSQTRPTASNLFWALKRMMSLTEEPAASPSILKSRLAAEAQRIADEDVEANKRIGEYGSHLLSDGDVVLTHCN